MAKNQTPLTAQQLNDFLNELKLNNNDLSKVNIYYRTDSDCVEELVTHVGEDLFDAETNSELRSIMLMNTTEENDSPTCEDLMESELEFAKGILKKNGYCTESMWHIDDVKQNYKVSDEQAMQVLVDALSDSTSMYETIDIVAEQHNLKRK
jgi:hypothetical protein